MYARLVDGELQFPTYRNGMLVDPEHGIYIINPKDQHYRAAGYKPLIETPVDIPPKKGYIIIPVYTDNGDAIIQSWKYRKESGGSTGSGTDSGTGSDGTITE